VLSPYVLIVLTIRTPRVFIIRLLHVAAAFMPDGKADTRSAADIVKF